MTSAHLHHSPATAFGRALLHALAANWWTFLLRGLAAIAFGLFAFFTPAAAILALVFVWASYAVIDGGLTLWAAITGATTGGARWWLGIAGVSGVLVGVLAFMWPGPAMVALTWFIAAWSVVVGAMQVAGAIRLRKEVKGEWFLILAGALSVSFGVLLFSQPAAGVMALTWLIGLFSLVIGATYVLFALRLRQHRND